MDLGLIATGVVTPPVAAPVAPPVDPREAAAQRLYPVAPPAPQATSPNKEVDASRAADAAARTMYRPEMQYGSSLDALALATNPEGRADALARQKVELANIAADVGFNSADLNQLATLVRQRHGKPPTEAEIAAERRDAVAQLRSKYREDFDSALSGAMGLVQRDPRLHAYIKATGMEADPWLVLRMAELARSARNR